MGKKSAVIGRSYPGSFGPMRQPRARPSIRTLRPKGDVDDDHACDMDHRSGAHGDEAVERGASMHVAEGIPIRGGPRLTICVASLCGEKCSARRVRRM